MKNYINFINESNQMTDLILKCVNEGILRPLTQLSENTIEYTVLDYFGKIDKDKLYNFFEFAIEQNYDLKVKQTVIGTPRSFLSMAYYKNYTEIIKLLEDNGVNVVDKDKVIKIWNDLKINKNSIVFSDINNFIYSNSNNYFIRPVYSTGSGRYTRSVDLTYEIKDILNKIGVEYIDGNDAPRGGKLGNYIKIISKLV